MEVRTSPESPSENFARAIRYSREEAIRFSHLEIDLDDLLLGLLREDSSNAVTILSQLGHKTMGLRGEIEPLAVFRTANDPQRADILGVKLDDSRKVLLTQDAEDVVKAAFSEAVQLGKESPGTEDLLLSILLKENTLTQKLSEIGITYEGVRIKAQSL
jgi:ATP-dependent Clp protease ATP-binding subunit ClpA